MSDLQPGTSQRDVDRAAGEEEAQCVSCGRWLGEDSAEFELCEPCAESASQW